MGLQGLIAELQELLLPDKRLVSSDTHTWSSRASSHTQFTALFDSFVDRGMSMPTHEHRCSTKTLHGLSCLIPQPSSSNRVTANDQLTQSLFSCVRGTSSWATLTSNSVGRMHSRNRRSIPSRSTIQRYTSRPSECRQRHLVASITLATGGSANS